MERGVLTPGDESEDFTRSESLYRRAREMLPGGVSSPVRAFGGVGGEPIFIHSGRASRVTGVDGRSYLDLVMSWGPLIHGHAHPEILNAIYNFAQRGTTFGAPTAVELELGEAIQEAIPSMAMLRFVSSGTEATMSVLRLSRAFTGRQRVVKFAGCYHGHVDALLVEAGSGALTHGVPSSAGLPEHVANDTIVLAYNDPESFRRVMDECGAQIAAVIVEPVAGNMGTVSPSPEFIHALRSSTQAAGTLLIFDEVITGFRLAAGGVQSQLGVTPDLTCLGKIIGGGLPAAAFGGRAEVMRLLAPLGPVYQAGTLSGNPLAMAAGAVALRLCAAEDYARLVAMANHLRDGLVASARDRDIPMTVGAHGSMLTPFFTSEPVSDLAGAKTADTALYAKFFHGMLRRGVYLPPSQFETWMLSFAHTMADIDMCVAAADETFQEIAAN